MQLPRTPLSRRLQRAPVTSALLWTNIGVFVLEMFIGHELKPFGSIAPEVTQLMGSNFGLATFRELRLETLVTYAFLHGGLMHLFFNMVALISVGPLVEEACGSARMAYLYLIAAIAGGIPSAIYYATADRAIGSVGASGAICGVIAAAATVAWRRNGFRAPLTQMLVRWIGFIFAFGLGMALIGSHGIDNWAHAGGTLAGVVVALLWKRGYVYPSKATRAMLAVCGAVVLAAVGVVIFRDATNRFAAMAPRERLEYAAESLRVGQCDDARAAISAFQRLRPKDRHGTALKDEIEAECTH